MYPYVQLCLSTQSMNSALTKAAAESLLSLEDPFATASPSSAYAPIPHVQQFLSFFLAVLQSSNLKREEEVELCSQFDFSLLLRKTKWRDVGERLQGP